MSNPIAAIAEELVALVEMERHHARHMITNNDTPMLSRMRHLDVTHLLLGDEWFVLTDGTPDVLWPISCAFAMRTPEDGWNFCSARSVSAKEVRGKISRPAQKMLMRSVVSMDRHGVTISMNEYASFLGGRWISATYKPTTRHHDSVRLMPNESVTHTHQAFECVMGIALRQRYEWSVSLRTHDGPSFRFATDATGVREMLKERDKNDNNRRAALRHWVVSHWRQSRTDEESESYVRQHLRGGEKFYWRGYEAEWMPSQFDIEQNKKLADERRLMGRQAVRHASSRKVGGST
jgi:hypothetical protein